MKPSIPPVLIIFGLVCFALVQNTQAVSPPPDGGYPGGNTAEGQLALGSLTTGIYNTAIGIYSLLSLTDGRYNTGVGAGALFANATTQLNTAIGAGALFNHTIGNGNTANGTFALFSDTSGQINTAVGAGALLLNTTGSFLVAVGESALYSNTGNDNTAIGATALANNTTGSDNTAVGLSALPNNTTGSNNVALGAFAGQSVTTASQVICIGAQGGNTDNSCWIGQIFGATAAGGSAVFIDANNRLGTITSSKRFKEDIKPMGEASETLFSLEPVAFRYKKEIDPAGTSQFGLIAEEVAKVNPNLVVLGKDGKPYTVRYEQINAMLLNEFLKEHRKNEEQEVTIARQQKQIDALTAGLQKLSAQLEASRSAPQVADSNY